MGGGCRRGCWYALEVVKVKEPEVAYSLSVPEKVDAVILRHVSYYDIPVSRRKARPRCGADIAEAYPPLTVVVGSVVKQYV